MAEKLLVINGCSHSSGSEISGPLEGDNRECRDNSFGAVLAGQLGRRPVHLAMPGGCNDWIARITAAWVGDHAAQLRSGEIDAVFLIHWTGAERWEYRFRDHPFDPEYIDYEYDQCYRSFTHRSENVNKLGEWPKRVYDTMNHSFVMDEEFWSDNKIKNVIFTQELLKSQGCRYWFGNASTAFNAQSRTPTFRSLFKLLDQQLFPYHSDEDLSFYFMCKQLGFKNQDPLERIWHLGRDAHSYYAGWLREQWRELGMA
jgi:hypothetical protein